MIFDLTTAAHQGISEVWLIPLSNVKAQQLYSLHHANRDLHVIGTLGDSDDGRSMFHLHPNLNPRVRLGKSTIPQITSRGIEEVLCEILILGDGNSLMLRVVEHSDVHHQQVHVNGHAIKFPQPLIPLTNGDFISLGADPNDNKNYVYSYYVRTATKMAACDGSPSQKHNPVFPANKNSIATPTTTCEGSLTKKHKPESPQKSPPKQDMKSIADEYMCSICHFIMVKPVAVNP